MEANAQTKRRWLLPLLIAALVIVIAVLAVVLLQNRTREETSIEDGGVPKIGYAEGVTIVDDPDALQKAVDEMYAKAAEGNIALEYQNEALSEDGENFSCYIANSVKNSYDMYIDIYADVELTDEIFLSGLIRPGNAFREITLNHPLEPGVHTVYAAFTQVEEDLETIHGQILVTMEFTVAG